MQRMEFERMMCFLTAKKMLWMSDLPMQFSGSYRSPVGPLCRRHRIPERLALRACAAYDGCTEQIS